MKAPPKEGQPDTFHGAVGKYTMTVTATPQEVSVGDPISLNLTIRGTGRMDSLQAPRLASQESLTANFRVPGEELAGTVSGMVKEFSQTIREAQQRDKHPSDTIQLLRSTGGAVRHAQERFHSAQSEGIDAVSAVADCH